MNIERLVLGPPGCGKTTRLLSLLESELEAGVSPDKIAYVSFTRQAVNEAVKRVEERFDYKAKDLPYFRTLHSLCYRAMGMRSSEVMKEQHYKELGDILGYEFTLSKLNPEDGMPLENRSSEGTTLLFVTGLARNRRVSLEDQWHEVGDYDLDLFALKRLDRELSAFKRQRGLLDYTDMLEEIARSKNALPVEVAIIDEAQDLSTLQWEVCRAFFAGAQRVYIAGDDDQAIYRWAGADVETFLNLGGRQEVLGLSYRLPQAVYARAHEVVTRIQHRYPKVWSPRDDVGEVVRLPHEDMLDFSAPGSWMVLSRNSFQLNAVEMILHRDGHLFTRRDGHSSVNFEHYQAILIWENLRKGKRVSGADARLMYNYMRTATGVKRGFKGVMNIEEEKDYSIEELREHHGLIADGVWHDALDGIALNIREYYRMILRSGRKLSDHPTIRIGTIHSVKGGEADNVALLTDMSQRTFRNYQKFPDDENRVFYVGMTRARHRLLLLDARSPNAFTV